MEDKSSGERQKRSGRKELHTSYKGRINPGMWTPKGRGVTIEGWQPQLDRGQIRKGPVLLGPAIWKYFWRRQFQCLRCERGLSSNKHYVQEVRTIKVMTSPGYGQKHNCGKSVLTLLFEMRTDGVCYCIKQCSAETSRAHTGEGTPIQKGASQSRMLS